MNWREGISLRFTVALLCLAAPLLQHRGALADTVSDIYQQLQQRPQDVALNLRYAMEAERIGKLKWALPAYERVLAAEPGNNEALRGIDRVTRKLRAEAQTR